MSDFAADTGGAGFDSGSEAPGATSSVQEPRSVTPRRTRSRVKAGIDQAQDAIAEAADKVADASAKAEALAGDLGTQAVQAYDRAQRTVRQVDARLEPFVQEQPYAALALAAGLGFVIGMLFARRGPKVIYVRTPR